jgi:hypothetical protein
MLVSDSFYKLFKGPTGFRIQISSDPTVSTGLKGEKMRVEWIFIPKSNVMSHFVE